MPGTVVEVTEVLVESPLVDGAQALVRRLAVCSTFENAAICARQAMTERSGETSGILYYVLDMIILDTAHQMAPTAVFGGDDKLRGMIPGDIEEPWGGHEGCAFKLGDLVGFVSGGLYRIGVVLALPPTPEEAQRLGATLGDDVYLVGVRGLHGNPETNEHVPQPLLFPVEEAAPETGTALKKRAERYGR